MKAKRIDRDRLWRHLETLCLEIGPRLSGSPADERAVAYIAGHFQRCGAEVEVQDFPCPSWEHASTELTLLDGGGDVQGALEGQGAPESAVVPAVGQTFSVGGEVVAPLAAVGSWVELDLAPDLEGKVLLLDGDAARGLAMDRNATLLTAEERRVAAVIVVSPLETVSTKLIRDPFLGVPAVGVPRSEGERLRRHVGQGVRLRLQARRYASTGHNVIARIAGKGPERVVVAAHYDSAALAPGATDNASGTAAVLELCEVFGGVPPPALGIELVAFGADEYGRHGGNLGAAEYVRRHPQEVRQARCVVEADGIGTAPRKPRLRLVGWRGGARAEVLEVLRRFPQYEVDDQSDRPDARPVAFHLPGVPAVHLVDDYRHLPIHTPADTIDLMSPDGLALAAEVMAALVGRLAGAGPTP
jgi:aminopeptidase YwaD